MTYIHQRKYSSSAWSLISSKVETGMWAHIQMCHSCIRENACLQLRNHALQVEMQSAEVQRRIEERLQEERAALESKVLHCRIS